MQSMYLLFGRNLKENAIWRMNQRYTGTVRHQLPVKVGFVCSSGIKLNTPTNLKRNPNFYSLGFSTSYCFEMSLRVTCTHTFITYYTEWMRHILGYIISEEPIVVGCATFTTSKRYPATRNQNIRKYTLRIINVAWEFNATWKGLNCVIGYLTFSSTFKSDPGQKVIMKRSFPKKGYFQ